MKKYYFHIKLISAVFLLLLTACKKERGFLAAKPDQQLFVPSTLTDLSNLMHDEQVFNNGDPGLGEIACDDFYVTDAVWTGLGSTLERNGYIWAKQVYDAGQDVNEWTQPYQQVYYANTVLDNLPGIAVAANQQAAVNEIKGDALFFRGRAFYNLLQDFTLPYDSQTAKTELGIPLRLSSDLNIKSVRADEQSCYDQVTSDLQTSASLLPVKAAYPTEPSQPAANGYLSRVYLALGNYQKALDCASLALTQFSALTDYNSLMPQARSISTGYISEDIFHSVMISRSIFSINSTSLIDTALYGTYAANDLRKTDFYLLKTRAYYFRGTYDYKHLAYNGIATDELYLDRAECEARLGNAAAAMTDLNNLLVTRWKHGTFIPYTANSADDALAQILDERRKEFPYRGLRWTDLRRLNKDSRFAVTLTRFIKGTKYSLPPNDIRYAWPIPDDEISSSHIQQNAR